MAIIVGIFTFTLGMFLIVSGVAIVLIVRDSEVPWIKRLRYRLTKNRVNYTLDGEKYVLNDTAKANIRERLFDSYQWLSDDEKSKTESMINAKYDSYESFNDGVHIIEAYVQSLDQKIDSCNQSRSSEERGKIL